MKPSELASSGKFGFDFVVPDHSYVKGSGPTLLPIRVLLPHDPSNTNIIKGKHVKNGVVYYMIGDASRRTDRRPVPATQILRHISRRLYEEYEAKISEPKLLEALRIQDELEAQQKLEELDTPRREDALEARRRPLSSASKRAPAGSKDVVMGGLEEAKSMFVGQNISFASVNAPLNIPKVSSTSAPPSGMLVDRNGTADRLTNFQAAGPLNPFRSLLQTARPKRKHKGPFLPNTDDEEEPESVQPSTSKDTNSARNDGFSCGASIMAKKKIPSTVGRPPSIAKQSSHKSQRESRKRALSVSSEAIGSVEDLSSAAAEMRKKPKRRKRSWETRLRDDRRRKSLESRVSKAEEESGGDKDEEWEVKGLIKDEIRRGSDGKVVRWFLVDWEGEWEPSWEPEANVARDTIENYYKKKDTSSEATARHSGHLRVGFHQLKAEHFKNHIGKASAGPKIQTNNQSDGTSQGQVFNTNGNGENTKHPPTTNKRSPTTSNQNSSNQPIVPPSLKNGSSRVTASKFILISDSEDELAASPNTSIQTEKQATQARQMMTPHHLNNKADVQNASMSSKGPTPNPLAQGLPLQGTPSSSTRGLARMRADAYALYSPLTRTNSSKKTSPNGATPYSTNSLPSHAKALATAQSSGKKPWNDARVSDP